MGENGACYMRYDTAQGRMERRFWRDGTARAADRARLKALVNDSWEGPFTPTQVASHEFMIEAWWDVFESYRYELSKKHAAGDGGS